MALIRLFVWFLKMCKRDFLFSLIFLLFFLSPRTWSAQESEKEPSRSKQADARLSEHSDSTRGKQSDSTPGKQSGSIELLNADFSELRMEKDNIMLNLIGHVKFRHGEINLESQRAVWYRTAGQVVFIDSVRVEDPDQVLSADRVTYYKNSRKVIADGGVKLFSKKEDAVISGGHGEYDRTAKFVFFSQSPVLVFRPNQGDSTVTITSQSMEYYIDQEEGIAKGNVLITKGTLRATCDSATSLRKENKIILEGKPEAEKERDRLSGERMEIHLRDEKVEEIEVSGNAKASHLENFDSLGQRPQADSLLKNKKGKESFLSSKEMVFLLKDEKLKEVKASGNATSIYYPSQKGGSISQKKPSGDKNEASGDTINLFLSDDRIRRVLIEGGAMGTYSFPKEKTNDSSSSLGGVEDTIKYSADNIDYVIENNLITLEGKSSLEYGQILLTAGEIYYNTEKEILVAEGMKKSPGETGATEEQGESDLPVLKDGKEEIKGRRMTYDLSTKRGKVEVGVTQFEGGIYHGEELRKITDKVILADEGSYTTCDKREPHFHFYSRRMKIIAKDKVIAKPVVLYIADLPVAAIPFYVFPIKPGRHSGFLTFDFGNLQAGQRFIRNLGYYWAASDYWDLETAFDYYESSGWLLKSQARYAVRYLLDGSISGSYNRESGWNTFPFTKWRRSRWDLVINHRQTISPSLSLSAYGSFLSDKDFWRDLNLDPNERRNRSLHSQMNLSQRWANTSLTLALDQTLNLDSDERSDLLPILSLSRSTLPLFPSKGKKEGGISQNSLDKPTTRWYNSIYYSLSSNFVNYNYKQKTAEYSDRKKYMVSDNFLNLSAPQKLFGWLVLNPGFNYQETWYYIFKTNLSDAFPIAGNSSARRGTYSTSLSAQTTIFGTFQPKIGKLVGIRHVMTPNLSFVWQPEFNRKKEYQNYTGRGSGGGKQKAMNFSLSNLFQLKTKSISGGKEVEKKLDLFTLNFSSGYNFLAKEHKLTNLSTVMRSTAIRNVDLSFSATHDFYDKNTGKLNLLSPRWLYFSFDTRLTFHGSWQESKVNTGEKTEGLTPSEENLQVPKETVSQTWSVDISHRFSKTRGASENHWVSVSLRLPLTRNWLLNYVNRYDFSEMKITEQTFELYRDMHCWEGRFTWIVNGYKQGYYFRINIKALPAIKIEKSQGGIREIFF
jgi:lipopolysaccharide assembly outer membrane protein LptD (OstA)